MIKLSVVVPTCNRRQALERTIPALLSQDFPPEDFEIIVVVDGSTDGTAALLRTWSPRCSLRVLETHALRRGPGAARNVGIHAAVGELVLFLDDDLLAAPGLLRQHFLAHSSPDPVVAFGPIYVDPRSPETLMRYVTEENDEAWYRNLDPELRLRFPEPVPSPLTITILSFLVNASVRRKLVLEAGGFDEAFFAAEDRDLGLRLWKMGVQFRYRPAALAREFYLKSAKQHLEQQGNAMNGDLLISRKHPEHRPYSVLAGLAETDRFKGFLRKVVAQSSFPSAALLAFPLRAEKQLCRWGPSRGIGIRLLGIAERILRLRAAVASAGSWKNLEKEFGRRLPALMYHHVGPLHPDNYRYLTVPPKQFEEQIRWLACHGYVGIRPSDWLRWRRDGTGLPDKPILITFDDAYEETAKYALPILRQYGFGAAVFVVTERLGGSNTWDEARGCGTLQLMTADQIRTWADQGIEFGAHSQTHPDLTALSKAECRLEVLGSKSDLSALLHAPIISFAYPYGKHTDSVRAVVQSEFDLAFSVEEGINYLRGDPHLLRRAYVGPDDSLLEFALIVRWGGMQRFRELRAKFRVRSRLKKAMRLAFRARTNANA